MVKRTGPHNAHTTRKTDPNAGESEEIWGFRGSKELGLLRAPARENLAAQHYALFLLNLLARVALWPAPGGRATPVGDLALLRLAWFASDPGDDPPPRPPRVFVARAYAVDTRCTLITLPIAEMATCTPNIYINSPTDSRKVLGPTLVQPLQVS